MDVVRSLGAPLEAREHTALQGLLRELAEAAGAHRFRVAPNPCVGAAVLSDGVEIGRGFHEVWGGPHAEVRALEAAAASGVPRERWDTLVVTLEPCSTQGKTPPCTEAILAAGVRRVVVGALDPDPRHRGRSLEELHNAGLEVALLQGATPLEEYAPHFLAWTRPERLRRSRPWTIAKWAQTRTGQLSPPADVGGGRWISGPSSLAEVQELRSRVDAILTGIGTVQADDPRFTVRPPADPSAPPLRIVLDSELRLWPDAKLFAPPGEGEGAGAVHVLSRPGSAPARHRALRAAGAQVHSVRAGDDGRLSPRAVGAWLWSQGIRRVLLEAGPKVIRSWFEAGVVDQVTVYTGNINGGRGPSLAELLVPARLSQVQHREVGEDAILEAFLDRR